MRLAAEPLPKCDVPGTHESIRRHGNVLRRFEDSAERFWAEGNVEDAVATVAAAGHFAALNHPGVLASPRLEALLARISCEQVTGPSGRRAPGAPQRILAVVTETYGTGAHTRLLWRWIARDPGRVYTVVTTAQGGVMPDGVRDAVTDSGGEVVDLAADSPALARAGALRGLAAEADLIVLMDHPWDPLPTLAFAGMTDRPPIVMFNHGDHLLWLGRNIVDVLMCGRPVGAKLTARRGFPSDRVLMTPFPMSGPDDHGRRADEPVRSEARAQARTEVLNVLGWPRDTVLLVTVGSAYKYEGSNGDGFLDLVEPVLLANPNAHLVAAGPTSVGRWRELEQQTGGRVRALGEVSHGIGALHMAGDIYLESRPFGGPGASAEAATHGLPVIGGADTQLVRDVLATDPVYGAVLASDTDSYRRLLTELIADPAMRERFGEASRQAVAMADANWEASVDCAYAMSAALGPIDQAELGPLPEPDETDLVVDSASPDIRRLTPEHLERTVALYELIGRSPAVRSLFGRLNPPEPRQERRYDIAFAAPPAEPAALRAVVDEFRALQAAGVAAQFVMALRPEDSDVAIPLLEAAISQGTDVDIALVLDDDPLGVRPAGSLEVVIDEAFAGAPPRHVCAATRSPLLPV